LSSGSFQRELEQRATRAILTRSFYRWESAVIIAVTLILTFLSRFGALSSLPVFQSLWWGWLVLGGLGEVALIWSSLKDPEFRARAVAEMFREKFNPKEIEDKDLRSKVIKALEYRDSIDEEINTSREGIMRDHLRDASGGITHWMENTFRLARRLDSYRTDHMIQRDRTNVEPEIEALKKRLAAESDAAIKQQITQSIAQKQIQRDNLNKLEQTMGQAESQLDSTLTAMGTVYSQVKLLKSKGAVSSGRAQRLQQDVSDQVQALQDVVQTMDEVYQLGTGQLDLGLSSAELAALQAQGQSGQKSTAP
jgi:hypothetical protein